MLQVSSGVVSELFGIVTSTATFQTVGNTSCRNAALNTSVIRSPIWHPALDDQCVHDFIMSGVLILSSLHSCFPISALVNQITPSIFSSPIRSASLLIFLWSSLSFSMLSSVWNFLTNDFFHRVNYTVCVNAIGGGGSFDPGEDHSASTLPLDKVVDYSLELGLTLLLFSKFVPTSFFGLGNLAYDSIVLPY